MNDDGSGMSGSSVSGLLHRLPTGQQTPMIALLLTACPPIGGFPIDFPNADAHVLLRCGVTFQLFLQDCSLESMRSAHGPNMG